MRQTPQRPTITADVTQTNNELNEAEQTLAASQAELDAASNELDSAATSLAQLQGQLDAAQSGFEDEVALLQEQLGQLNPEQADALLRALNDTVARGDVWL